MRPHLPFLALLVFVASIILTAAPATTAYAGSTCDPDGPIWAGATCDSDVTVVGSDTAAGQGAPVSGGSNETRYQRHALCLEWFTEEWGGARAPSIQDGDIPTCVNEVPLPTDLCPDGEVPLTPWWRSQALPGGGYGPWEQVSSYQCGSDIIYAQVAREWANMPIAPTTYTLQPGHGWAIAELGVNPIADPTPQTMPTVILGTNVIIRAVPTTYSWTADDGTRYTTSDPGRPYDQGGTPFPLAKSQHRATVNLTTTWRGEFSVDGGATWRDAPGTATTTSAPTVVHVYNPHTHLVDCDVNGNCLSGNGAPTTPQTLLDPDGDGIDNYLIPDNQIADYLATRDAGATWHHSERKTFN